MKSNVLVHLMKTLLLLSLVSIAGCAANIQLPEVGDRFSEYKTTKLELEGAIEYPQLELKGPIEYQGERVWYFSQSDLVLLDQYTLAAEANEASVDNLVSIASTIENERDNILNACIALEDRARVYRSAYINEMESSKWKLMQSVGLGSLIALLGITI